MTTISVVDHGAGNLVSIGRALEQAGAQVVLADTPEGLTGADGVVLPGVGTTAAAMRRLRSTGLDQALRAWRGPLLGICVGLQLFFEESEEHDGGACLGLMPGRVSKLEEAPLLPHIGWNDVATNGHRLFAGIPHGTPFYFVHSFAPVPEERATIIGTTVYGQPFAAAVATGAAVGVQFHPERSGAAGLRLLGNFVSLAEAARAA